MYHHNESGFICHRAFVSKGQGHKSLHTHPKSNPNPDPYSESSPYPKYYPYPNLILGCVTGCIYHRSVAVLCITGQMRHRAINIFTLTPELGVLPCVTWPMFQRAYESQVCSGSMCHWAFVSQSLCGAGPLFQDKGYI